LLQATTTNPSWLLLLCSHISDMCQVISTTGAAFEVSHGVSAAVVVRAA
jgi:hypothetical protein